MHVKGQVREPGEFASPLRGLRDAVALTQEELAGRTAVTVKTVAAPEPDEWRRPYPHTVRRPGRRTGTRLARREALTGAARAPARAATPAPDQAQPATPLFGRTRGVVW